MATMWAVVIQASQQVPPNVSAGSRRLNTEEQKSPKDMFFINSFKLHPSCNKKACTIIITYRFLNKTVFLLKRVTYLYNWILLECWRDENNKSIQNNDLVIILSLSRKEYEKQRQTAPVSISSVCKLFSLCPRELTHAEFHGAAGNR